MCSGVCVVVCSDGGERAVLGRVGGVFLNAQAAQMKNTPLRSHKGARWMRRMCARGMGTVAFCVA